MSPGDPIETEQEHLPARSGTPTAWISLGILALLFLGWVFFNPLFCGVLGTGLHVAAWWKGEVLEMKKLSFVGQGWIEARDLRWSFGPAGHRSSLKCDSVSVRLAPLGDLLLSFHNRRAGVFRETRCGKGHLLIDVRGDSATGTPSKGLATAGTKPFLSAGLLPGAMQASSLDVIVIGENFRMQIDGFAATLPHQWPGTISYRSAVFDLGTAHHVFSAAKTDALWNGATLRLGRLTLNKTLELADLRCTMLREGVEFGWRGRVGKGMLRGDGAWESSREADRLEVTVVGENLPLESLTGLVSKDGSGTTGRIRQGKFSFRGNPARPVDADASLRIVADDVRWQGLGWNSLRLAATLTGRTLALSDLVLRQDENEVVAEGRSTIPGDWRSVLRAPFSATFHADLQDAAALASLVGPEYGQLSGGLWLEGSIKGADNRAEGYCNVTGRGMTIRSQPVDWLKAALLFEGETTRLTTLEAASGEDTLSASGSIQNNRPHSYEGSARLKVGNMTRLLSRLGLAESMAFGAASVNGTWEGRGSAAGHTGSFRAEVADWVSVWTAAGMTGAFEGTYAPGSLRLTKASLQQEDLKLSCLVDASSKRLEVKAITATRTGVADPVANGELSVPLDLPGLWRGLSLARTLSMGEPLSVALRLKGLGAGEFAELLGQRISCSGTLAGEIRAGGTPEKPEIKATLGSSRFVFGEGAAPLSGSLGMESANGRASVRFIPAEAASSPLAFDAEGPFRWSREGDQLVLADSTGPLKGSATCRRLPLSDWPMLIAGTALPFAGSTLDGTITLSGSAAKPQLDGRLQLAAKEARLPFGIVLRDLELPAVLAGDKATLGPGTATFGAGTVSLLGSGAWSGTSPRADLQLTGKDLALPVRGGTATLSAVNIRLRCGGGELPQLGGEIQLGALRAPLRVKATPFFSPPGFILAGEQASLPTAPGIWNTTRLDLGYRTVGGQPIATAETGGCHPALAADFKLTGSVGTPVISGSATVKQMPLDLPCGTFVAPEAVFRPGERGAPRFEASAVGLTPRGFCTILFSGAPGPVRFWGVPGVGAPDLITALTKSPKGVMPGSALPQSLAWLRQRALADLPASGWFTGRLGAADAASLGFYGTPWAFVADAPLPGIPSPSQP